MKPVAGRLFLLSIAVLVSLVFFLPSTPLFSAMPEWWKQYLPNKGITLGLDLQGGIHLVLEVEADRAVEIKLDRDMAAMTELFAEKKVPVESVKRTGPTEITVALSRPEAKEAVLTLTDDQFPMLSSRLSGNKGLVFTLKADEAERIKKAAISQALETVRNRVDQFGVAEPLIQQQGLRQIVVQLPGVKDPGRAKALIKNTALLEFKMLDEDHKVARELPSRVPAGKEEEVLKEFGPQIPPEDEILFERHVDKQTGRVMKTPYLIKKRAVLTGDVLTDARVAIGQFQEAYVSVTFDSTGAKLFERITAENVKKRMAIILDNTVYSAPVIQERIGGGRAQITGSFSTEEANDLAIILRAGALPAPVKIIQDLTVGPSLGRDSIEKGVRPTVDAGYDKAFLTIVDSHVTTLITGFALFLFGTGPIKGFAVTLCLGIAINLFTALVGTKVIYDLLNRRGRMERLSI